MLAGASPAVVSYVLNGGPRGVAPDTRARVLAAVEQLGYRPTASPGRWRNRTMTLGLVVPDTSNPTSPNWPGPSRRRLRAGYTLLIGNATEDEARQTTYVRTFLQRQVDGLFLVPAHGPLACLPELGSGSLGGARPAPGRTRRTRRGLADPRRQPWGRAARHRAPGRARRQVVACIAGPRDVMPTTDRVAGWRNALRAAGNGPRGPSGTCRSVAGRATWPPSTVRRPSARRGLRRERRAGGGGAAGAHELGVRCPDDVAVRRSTASRRRRTRAGADHHGPAFGTRAGRRRPAARPDGRPDAAPASRYSRSSWSPADPAGARTHPAATTPTADRHERRRRWQLQPRPHRRGGATTGPARRCWAPTSLSGRAARAPTRRWRPAAGGRRCVRQGGRRRPVRRVGAQVAADEGVELDDMFVVEGPPAWRSSSSTGRPRT